MRDAGYIYAPYVPMMVTTFKQSVMFIDERWGVMYTDRFLVNTHTTVFSNMIVR